MEYQDICLIYPPLVEDIIKVGFETFLSYFGLLTRSSEDLEDELGAASKDGKIPTPFDFLIILTALSPEVKSVVEKAFEFFTHQKVTFLYEIASIAVGDVAEQRLITKDNFFDFQNAVRAAAGEKPIPPPDPNENPRIKRFKALQRKRDRVKAKNSKNEAKEFNTLLTSLCCMNLGLNPLNIGKISFAAMKMLMARYAEKDMYETRVAAMLAGAEGDKKDSYWIRDLDN